MIITLKNAVLTVQIDTYGGELQSVCDCEGTEYLWQGDARYWEGKSPNLFPYIARLTQGKYLYQGQEYHMGIHGFVWISELEIVSQTETSVVFRKVSDDQTRAEYPFDFEYLIHYTLSGSCLQMGYEVINTGHEPMYFGIGGHPGFRVPLEPGNSFEDYCLEFGKPCQPVEVCFSEDHFPDGREREFLLENNKIWLKHSLFDNDAVVLKNTGDSVMLKSRTGKKSVTVEYPQMDYLGLWHAPHTDAPYVCIEPWSSLPSRKGVVEDLEKQENLIALASQRTYRNTWCIVLRTGGKEENNE